MRTVHGNLIRFTSLCLLGAAASFAASAHGQEHVFNEAAGVNYAGSATLADCSL